MGEAIRAAFTEALSSLTPDELRDLVVEPYRNLLG